MVELVKVDLERNWQAGRREPLAAYLDKYPSLGDRTTVPPELIQAEIDVREQFGAAAGREFLAAEYPGREHDWLPILDAGPTVNRAAETSRAVDDTLIKNVEQSAPDATVKAEAEVPKTFGRYRLLKVLGRGGMGSVYLAEDTTLHRKCAIKLPHFEKKRDREILERFLREAQAAASVRHDNICTSYDVGEINGEYFISMDFIDGRPLSDFISPSKPGRQRATVQTVLKLALALKHAHEKHIVHRDLKPANIMIKAKSQPVIMDFGLACSLEVSDKSRMTTEGTLLGTPAYMSPEQVLGRIREIGPRSDIYSLGVILYEMLTGQIPFRGSVQAILGQIIGQVPTPLRELRRDIDSDLEVICLKMMAKGPADRYQSMGEVAGALSEWLRRVNAGVDGAETMMGLALSPQAPASTPDAPVHEANPRNTAPVAPRNAPPLTPFTQSTDVDPKAQTLLTPPSIKRDRKRRKSGVSGWWLVVGLLGGIGLIWGIIIILTTSHGTLRIEVNDEDLEVAINGDDVRFTDLRGEMDLDDGRHDLKILVEGTEVPIGEAFTLTTREHEGQYRLVVQLGDTELSNERFAFERDGETALKVELVEIEEGVEDFANSERALASVVSIIVAMDNRSPLGVVTRDGIATVLPGGFTDVSVTSADGWSGAGTVGTRAPFPFCWIDVPDHNLPLVDSVPTERESVAQPAFLVHRDGPELTVEVVAGTFDDGTFDFDGTNDYKPNSGGVIAVGPVFDSDARCLGYAIRHDLGEPIRVYALRREDGETAAAAQGVTGVDSPNSDAAPFEEIMQFTRHQDFVLDLAISSGGTQVLSGDNSGRLLYWDVSTGNVVSTLVGHTSAIHCVALSGDGRHAVSGGGNKYYDNPGEIGGDGDFTVRLWELPNGLEVATLPQQDFVFAVAFSPDDQEFASACRNIGIERFDTETHASIASFPAEWLEALEYAPRESELFAGGTDGVHEWSLDSGEQLDSLRQYPAAPISRAVAISADGRYLYAGFHDGCIAGWNLQTGEPLWRISAHQGRVTGIALTAEDTRILTAGYDNTVRLWDLATRTEIGHFEGHTAAVYCVAASPNGEFAVSGGFDKTVRVWELPDANTSPVVDSTPPAPATTRDEPELLGQFPAAGFCMDVDVASDGVHAVSVDSEGKITHFDLTTESSDVVGMQTMRADQFDLAKPIALTRDGHFAVTGCSAWNGMVEVWDVAAAMSVGPGVPLGNGWLDVAFSDDGQSLFVANNTTVSFYQQPPDAQGWSADDLASSVTAVRGCVPVVADPDDPGRAFLRSIDEPGAIVLMDFATRSVVQNFPAAEAAPDGVVDSLGLAISADGSHLLTRNGTTQIQWWDARTGALLLTINQSGDPYPGSLALSPDGTTALIAKSDSVVEYWNLARNEVICEISSECRSSVFLSTGDRALFATRSGLQLWGLQMN